MATKPAQAPASGPGERDRLLLLDGHSLAYRAFFALPPENFSTTTGQPTNAVYGFTAMLINVLRDEQPTHVAVAFDRSEPTFRHEQYVEYKANRARDPGRLPRPAQPDLRGARRARHPAAVGAGLRGRRHHRHAGHPGRGGRAWTSLIVTGDRDALQLVSDDVTVLMTRRGVSEMTRFTPEAVIEKYGLTPAQYPDFAALRGDPSDNLPGIPGVGEKTATKWIAEFGSLADAGRPGRRGQGQGRRHAARAPARSVLRNRQLTELVRDVPLDAGAGRDLRPVPWDREQIHQLFDTLQFRVLRDRLYATLPNGIAGQPRPPPRRGRPGDGVRGGRRRARPRRGGRLAGRARQRRPAGPALAASGTWGRGTGRR